MGFNHIVNMLGGLCKTLSNFENVDKILRCLIAEWQPKVIVDGPSSYDDLCMFSCHFNKHLKMV